MAPKMKERDFKKRWSELHGDADVMGIVDGWLSISYQAARICSALRISPNVLTLMGLATAVAMVFTQNAFAGLLCLVISLLFDGIDGSVAIYQGRENPMGGLYDSVADRISEACWLYIGYRIGIPTWVVLSMWTIATVQEYARARLASLGHPEIGVVTPTERPVRASFMAIELVIFLLALPGIEILSYLFLALLFFSFIKVMRAAYRMLSKSSL
jgi:phosphatidylglycerophosphate synthase